MNPLKVTSSTATTGRPLPSTSKPTSVVYAELYVTTPALPNVASCAPAAAYGPGHVRRGVPRAGQRGRAGDAGGAERRVGDAGGGVAKDGGAGREAHAASRVDVDRSEQRAVRDRRAPRRAPRRVDRTRVRVAIEERSARA